MTFLAPAAAWILALLAPLVLLHMLRLRRPPQKVPSLLLWRQTMHDERVNAPLRRLRRDPLLLLQILLLLALAFAAMQPLFGTRAQGQAVVLVLDRSASMAARDAAGVSRIDAAKARATALFAEHAGSDVALVTFADGAELAAPFGTDARAFATALTAVQVEEVGGDLASALRLVAALGAQRELRQVILISDGNLNDAGDFALPFPLVFETLPPAGRNLGIVKLAARRDGADAWRVFVAVATSETGDAATVATARLVVELDGQPVGEVAVAPAPDQPERVELPVTLPDAAARDGAMLTLRLIPGGSDSLTSDDTAHLALSPGRLLRVRLDADLDTFARALAVFHDLELVDATPDLVIARTVDDLGSAAPLSLAVGAVPAGLRDVVTMAEGEGRVIDHDRLDPLLTHVEFDDLVVLDDVRWQEGKGEADLERAGFTTLVHGAHGPLLVRQRSPRGDRVAYALLFDPDRSTLPYRVAFPVLLSNLLTEARDLTGLRDLIAPRTGNLPPFAAAAGADVTLLGPAGVRAPLRADADGTVRGARAARVGAYSIEEGSAIRRLGVSLLDADESRLAPRATLRVGELSVAARAPAKTAAGSLWPELVAAGLLLACLEWWLYRRVRRRVLA